MMILSGDAFVKSYEIDVGFVDVGFVDVGFVDVGLGEHHCNAVTARSVLYDRVMTFSSSACQFLRLSLRMIFSTARNSSEADLRAEVSIAR
jgi:hypothetical protein